VEEKDRGGQISRREEPRLNREKKTSEWKECDVCKRCVADRKKMGTVYTNEEGVLECSFT